MICPLCGFRKSIEIHIDNLLYHQCENCELTFLNPLNRLNYEQEKLRYLKHNANVHDVQYQNFVMPMIQVIENKMKKTDSGLDFGSGTSAIVTYLLKQKGFKVESYDPFFANDEALLKNMYHFICACGVAEHFFEPKKEFLKLKNMLLPDGILVIMTTLLHNDMDFKNWAYRRDLTHVSFYSEKSLNYIKNEFSFKNIKIISNKLIIFEN